MFRAPRPANLPGFGQIVSDLPATQRQIAHHLDITERTLQRYATTDSAPRAIVLALFWETQWGRQAADAEAAEFGRVHLMHARSLERLVETQRRQVELLEQELQQPRRAANTPLYRVA